MTHLVILPTASSSCTIEMTSLTLCSGMAANSATIFLSSCFSEEHTLRIIMSCLARLLLMHLACTFALMASEFALGDRFFPHRPFPGFFSIKNKRIRNLHQSMKTVRKQIDFSRSWSSYLGLLDRILKMAFISLKRHLKLCLNSATWTRTAASTCSLMPWSSLRSSILS